MPKKQSVFVHIKTSYYAESFKQNILFFRGYFVFPHLFIVYPLAF